MHAGGHAATDFGSFLKQNAEQAAVVAPETGQPQGPPLTPDSIVVSTGTQVIPVTLRHACESIENPADIQGVCTMCKLVEQKAISGMPHSTCTLLTRRFQQLSLCKHAASAWPCSVRSL